MHKYISYNKLEKITDYVLTMLVNAMRFMALDSLAETVKYPYPARTDAL